MGKKSKFVPQNIDENFRLGKIEMGGYAFGDLAGQLLINFVSTFFLLFCTDYLGISSVAAGTIFLVARIWDAINDPLMGTLTDHTKTRFGSYRPWIAIGAPIVAITFIMMFVKIGAANVSYLAWAYAAYLLYGTAATITGVPYGTLSNVTTLNPRDRSLLGVVRDYGANIAGFLVSTFGTTLIIKLSNAEGEMTTEGFTKAAIVAAVIALICYYIVFFTQRERIEPPKTTVGFFKGVKITFKNKSALCLLLMGFCFNMVIQFKANMTAYYCINVLGNVNCISTILTLVYTLPLLGLLFVPVLMKKFERRSFLSVAGILTVVSGLISLIFGRSLAMQIVSSAFLGLALSCTFALIWASIPDAIDDGEVKTGQRAPGVTYALATFMVKAAAGISSFVAGWILALVKYDANLEVQSAGTINGIVIWYGVYPIIWGILMFIFSRIYKLDRKTVESNAEILAAKRAAESAETV